MFVYFYTPSEQQPAAQRWFPSALWGDEILVTDLADYGLARFPHAPSVLFQADGWWYSASRDGEIWRRVREAS